MYGAQIGTHVTEGVGEVHSDVEVNDLSVDKETLIFVVDVYPAKSPHPHTSKLSDIS